ncbi:unnamed protein product [Lepidochelys kempii]
MTIQIQRQRRGGGGGGSPARSGEGKPSPSLQSAIYIFKTPSPGKGYLTPRDMLNDPLQQEAVRRRGGVRERDRHTLSHTQLAGRTQPVRGGERGGRANTLEEKLLHSKTPARGGASPLSQYNHPESRGEQSRPEPQQQSAGLGREGGKRLAQDARSCIASPALSAEEAGRSGGLPPDCWTRTPRLACAPRAEHRATGLPGGWETESRGQREVLPPPHPTPPAAIT